MAEAKAEAKKEQQAPAMPAGVRTVREVANEAQAETAVNPVDFGAEVDVDDLPAVPMAGMFMAAEDATEPLAAGEEEPAPKKTTAAKTG